VKSIRPPDHGFSRNETQNSLITKSPFTFEFKTRHIFLLNSYKYLIPSWNTRLFFY